MRTIFTLIVFLFISSYAIDGIQLSAQVPSITIQTEDEILDEPKVLGTFTYIDPNGEIISSNIGIEIRGGFSQSYPKKTYDIEFWNDATGTETLDVQFGELRDDDDWVLDAMYNEPLRLNSFITHKLWLEMNQLYYADQEPKAKSGADVMYVEVTINNEYQGIYLLSEQVDRKLLKLKRNNNTVIRGELYKAYNNDDAVFFNDTDELPDNSSNTWSGYEFRYPSDFIDWQNAEELVDFVANSTDDAFTSEAENRFDFKNLMDYFILLNVARILDNRGKNIYLSRYDANEPYFLAPWDLDGSWGLLWDGSDDTNTQDVLSNNLFDRIIENDVSGFRQKISDRWTSLRSSILSDEALENRINSTNQFLIANQVYENEESAWEYEYAESDLEYIHDWIGDRLEFLDRYFKDITGVVNQANISFEIYPNPAYDYLIVRGNFKNMDEVRVYNIFGNLIKKEEKLSEDKTLFIQDLSPGTYIIEIGGNRKIFNKI
jgi:spore coat protein H